MPRIGLATCSSLPEWEHDDVPLFEALAERGATVVHPVWDDPAVDWSSFDLVLIRTTWDYMERPDAYLAWADRVATVTTLLNPPDIVRWNIRKTYLRDLVDRGVPVAPTVWLDVGTTADIAGIMQERRWTRGFLKPVVGATARETLRFEADDTGLQIAQIHLDRILQSEAMMVQPYLHRVETEGEWSAVFVDGDLMHGVVKRPVPGDYRTQDDFGGTDAPYVFTDDERTVLHRTLEAVGTDLLYARVDLLRDNDGAPCVTELELIEPSLFLRHGPETADRLASALLSRLR